MSVPVLPVGEDVALTTTAGGLAYRSVAVQKGDNLAVSLDNSTAAQAELLASFGRLPTETARDRAGPVTATSGCGSRRRPTEPGTCWSRREASGAGTPATLRADTVDFAVDAFSPAQGSRRGTTTLDVSGSGFEDGVVVRLANGPDGAVRAGARHVRRWGRSCGRLRSRRPAARRVRRRRHQPGRRHRLEAGRVDGYRRGSRRLRAVDDAAQPAAAGLDGEIVVTVRNPVAPTSTSTRCASRRTAMPTCACTATPPTPTGHSCSAPRTGSRRTSTCPWRRSRRERRAASWSRSS